MERRAPRETYRAKYQARRRRNGTNHPADVATYDMYVPLITLQQRARQSFKGMTTQACFESKP